jgi:hypothetical protein
MRNAHRWLGLLSFLLFALAGYTAFRCYVGAMILNHRTCCIESEMSVGMKPLFESGVIDMAAVAAEIGFPPWTDDMRASLGRSGDPERHDARGVRPAPCGRSIVGRVYEPALDRWERGVRCGVEISAGTAALGTW